MDLLGSDPITRLADEVDERRGQHLPLTGEALRLEQILMGLVEVARSLGFSVGTETDLGSSESGAARDGLTDHAHRRILLAAPNRTREQLIQVLAHELAHVILQGHGVYEESQSETEACAVSAQICYRLAVNVPPNSWYVEQVTNGDHREILERQRFRIENATQSILDRLKVAMQPAPRPVIRVREPAVSPRGILAGSILAVLVVLGLLLVTHGGH